LSYVSILAFQGQITELSTGEVSKNVRPAEFVGGSCIAFCITHQTCVVAVIERVRYGIECYYSTSVGGETLKVEDGHNVTQYEISRVCVARAKGERRICPLNFLFMCY